jgi:hypothetical protein
MFNKLDLRGIPNRKVYGKDKYNLASEQEQFTVDKLNAAYPDVWWYTMTEYMGIMNPEQNRVLGDIVGIRKNKDNVKPDIFIDLKVCEYGMNLYYVGNITLNSVLGFTHKQKGHYYLCVNANGSDFIVVDCKDVYNLLYSSNVKCLLESKWHNNKINPEYIKFNNKFIYDKKLEGVSEHDYIPGQILKKYDKRRGEN